MGEEEGSDAVGESDGDFDGDEATGLLLGKDEVGSKEGVIVVSAAQ